MGRPSTSGSRFLVKRSDSGIWAYHRNLPPDIAKGVIGEVRLYWSGRMAELKAKKVVAISLGTSDRREAERRRDQIHAQIEQIVDRAMREIRLVGMSAGHHVRLVPRLTPAQHRQIADWVYGSALAAQDDEMAEDPDEFLDNKRVAAWLERGWAEDAAQGTEAEVLSRMMERRSLDPDDPDDRSRGSVIEEILEDVGMKLVDPEQLRLAGLVILRARRRAWDALQRRDRGEPVETPPVSPLSLLDEKKEGPADTAQGPLLRETFDAFVTAKQMKPHTAADYKNQLERFIDLHGNIPVASVTRRMVLDFALTMERYPARFPDAWRGKRVQEIVNLASTRPDLRRMAPQTINDRAVGALKSFFGWCQKRRLLIETNPAVGVALDVPKSAEKPRKSYQLEHLRLIFSQRVFTKGFRPKRGAGNAMYWLPLIALYTGMRIEEIGQLRVKDLLQEDGIWVFDIVEEPPETSLKTASSKRKVPIHRDLIDRGLLVERESRIAAGDTRMFPLLQKNREGKYTAMFSKWWGLWSREIGIDDERLVFHSFRHTFKDKCRSSKIPVDIQDALLGHAGLTVGSGYGDGHDVWTLHGEIQKIDWSAVFSLPHEKSV